MSECEHETVRSDVIKPCSRNLEVRAGSRDHFVFEYDKEKYESIPLASMRPTSVIEWGRCVSVQSMRGVELPILLTILSMSSGFRGYNSM